MGALPVGPTTHVSTLPGHVPVKALDLRGFEHPVFIFIAPTDRRINKSVAWEVECKKCGHRQIAGSSQAKRGTHAGCVRCDILAEVAKREL